MLSVERQIITATDNSQGTAVTDWLSKWYGYITEIQTETPMVQLVSSESRNRDEQTATCRGTESHLSSLYSGTASLVLPSPNLVNLPLGVHLRILSLLDVASICKLSQTCRYMREVASDRLLWNRLLERDLHTWNVVGHRSHPQVYRDASSDLTSKQIYCYCRLHGAALPHPLDHSITSKFKSLVRYISGHVPKVLMFGSGLESLPVVRAMMFDDNSPYRPMGLYPGQDGVGSGMRIQHRDVPLNLVTLYTATRAERTAAPTGDSRRVNKLVSYYDQATEGRPELTQTVRNLCQHSDAMILAVDANELSGEALALDQTILSAMVRWPGDQSPLLVLACSNRSVPTLSPARVADKLELCGLTRPWQVHSIAMETLNGLQGAFDWLLSVIDR